LHRLHDGSQLKNTRRVVQVLAALPGFGKTSIAIEYAYHFRSDYALVWWFDASKESLISKGYCALAKRIDQEYEKHGISATEFLSEALSSFPNWLLILDDVSSADHALALLPKTGVGHVLITSPDRNWNQRADIFTVPPLSPSMAISYLKQRLAGSPASLSAGLIPELADELGCIPFALNVASSRLVATGEKIDDYLSKMRALRHRSFLLLGRFQSAELALAKTWEGVLHRAEYECPAVFVLGHLIKWFDDCEVPVELIERADRGELGDWARSIWSRATFSFLARQKGRSLHSPQPTPPLLLVEGGFTLSEGLATLLRYSFAERSASGFTVLPQVKVILRTESPKFRQRDSCKFALQLTAVFARHAFESGDKKKSSLWSRHLKKALEHARLLGVPNKSEAVKVARQVLDYFQNQPTKHVRDRETQVAPHPQERLSIRERFRLEMRIIKGMWPEWWAFQCAMFFRGISGLSILLGISGALYFYFNGITTPQQLMGLVSLRICMAVFALSSLLMACFLLIHRWKKKRNNRND
jgi:hypothetical protein